MRFCACSLPSPLLQFLLLLAEGIGGGGEGLFPSLGAEEDVQVCFVCVCVCARVRVCLLSVCLVSFVRLVYFSMCVCVGVFQCVWMWV